MTFEVVATRQYYDGTSYITPRRACSTLYYTLHVIYIHYEYSEPTLI